MRLVQAAFHEKENKPKLAMSQISFITQLLTAIIIDPWHIKFVMFLNGRPYIELLIAMARNNYST
jgi:hypothetical protein